MLKIQAAQIALQKSLISTYVLYNVEYCIIFMSIEYGICT